MKKYLANISKVTQRFYAGKRATQIMMNRLRVKNHDLNKNVAKRNLTVTLVPVDTTEMIRCTTC